MISVLYLVDFNAFHPTAYELDSQEIRFETREFNARILEDGSVLVEPDGFEPIIVPSDGTTVTGRIRHLRHVLCVRHSQEEAERKLVEMQAGDETSRFAEALLHSGLLT